jgi:phosphatidylglycerophosphatase A
MLIATGFYSGYLPKAPGTWGSLVGVLLVFLLHALSLQIYLSVIAGLFIVGSFVAGEAEKILDNRDPPLTMVLGFILFRVFDIAKPFPVNFFDQHFHGGLGIMLDDVVAGIYSLIIMQLIFLLAF